LRLPEPIREPEHFPPASDITNPILIVQYQITPAPGIGVPRDVRLDQRDWVVGYRSER
jgi:hypothetical protein